MPSAFKSPLKNEVSILGGNGALDGGGGGGGGKADFSYDDTVFARLKVAQDSLIEDLECKIVVSSVVGQAVLNGIVKALSDESAELLAAKDAEIKSLQVGFNDKAEEHSLQIGKITSDYFDKLKEKEMCMLEKERELCKMAESLVDLTFRLQGESLNNLALEKKIKEVEARDGSKQKKINALTEEIENLRRQKNSELESLKREMRIKEVRYTEQLEETIAENDAQLAALREENSEQVSKISALAANQEVVNEQVCQLIEAQKDSIEAIEELQVSMEEQKMQHDHEIEFLLDVYKGHLDDMHARFTKAAREGGDLRVVCEMEIDILATYFSSMLAFDDQAQEDSKEKGKDWDLESAPVEAARYSPHSIFSAGNGTSVIEEMMDREGDELEKDIILDCFIGFSENLRKAMEYLDVEGEQFLRLLRQLQHGRKAVGEPSYWKSHVQEKLSEQHHQHQLEMDVLLDFFVSKLGELSCFVMKRSETELAEVEGQGMQFADLQRENATLRREKDQVLVDKTEEMFSLKRDFFKELNKQKLECDEFGILKRQFSDSRQKLDKILDKKHGQPVSSCASDSDSSSGSESTRNDFGKFTQKLASELQNDVEQLMLNSGMAKPDDSSQKSLAALQQDYLVLNAEYECLSKALEDEKQKNIDLTAELGEYEHNVNLSNGELERLLRQVETEKQARLQKEGELQSIKHDVTLIRRQMETVLSQLESERSLKKRMQADIDGLQSQVELWNQRLEALQKELNDVLRVKVAIAEDNKKLRCEVFLLHQGIAQVYSEVERAVEMQTAGVSNNLANLRKAIDEKDARMRKVIDRLSKYSKLNKRMQSSYLMNLQKAEEEVDLLGDENDYLVNVLEKVFLALEHYSPVLQHYPGIADLAKLIKEELLSRVEQPGV